MIDFSKVNETNINEFWSQIEPELEKELKGLSNKELSQLKVLVRFSSEISKFRKADLSIILDIKDLQSIIDKIFLEITNDSL